MVNFTGLWGGGADAATTVGFSGGYIVLLLLLSLLYLLRFSILLDLEILSLYLQQISNPEAIPNK